MFECCPQLIGGLLQFGLNIVSDLFANRLKFASDEIAELTDLMNRHMGYGAYLERHLWVGVQRSRFPPSLPTPYGMGRGVRGPTLSHMGWYLAFGSSLLSPNGTTHTP